MAGWFRLHAADGQKRVFAAVGKGQELMDKFALWVNQLSGLALKNLKLELETTASKLREAAEENWDSISESRRIQACRTTAQETGGGDRGVDEIQRS